jgi:cell division septation protein DedD
MKKREIVSAIGIICLFSSFTLAAPATDSPYSQAQKLYSQGNFEAAAKIYESACAKLEAKEKKICQFNEVKALVESKKINLARAAEPKLLSLIAQTEPSDSLYAELSAEDAKLQVMLDQPVRAIRSWNTAQTSANTDYFPELFVLCQDIVSAYPANGLTAENCSKVKPADTSLISLQRKKITPLAQTASAPAPAPAQVPVVAPPATQGKWYVQLGAFGSKENAEKLVADFKNRGVQLYITELTDRKLFAVRAGNFANAEDAKIFAEQKIAPVHNDYKVNTD